MTLDQIYTVPLGTWDVGTDLLGQWQLGIHHHFDPRGQTLYMGTGRRIATSSPSTASRVRFTFAGFLGTAIGKTDRNSTTVVAGTPIQAGNVEGFATLALVASAECCHNAVS